MIYDTMNIRKIEAKDEQRVKELILSILTNEYPFDRKAYSDSDLNNIAESYSGPRDTFFVLDNNDDIVGTIGIKEDSQSYALIRRFFIRSDFRGKGYGKKLMDEAVGYCKSKDYKHVIFRGTNRMTQALELCRKKGFKEQEAIDMGGFSIYKLVLDL